MIQALRKLLVAFICTTFASFATANIIDPYEVVEETAYTGGCEEDTYDNSEYHGLRLEHPSSEGEDAIALEYEGPLSSSEYESVPYSEESAESVPVEQAEPSQ